MPLTFIDIERQKNWRIALFFAVLVLVYLAVVAVLGAAFAPFLLSTPSYFWTRLLPLAASLPGYISGSPLPMRWPTLSGALRHSRRTPMTASTGCSATSWRSCML